MRPTMTKFRRLFFCRSCNGRGNLDELTSGIIVVECQPCDQSELWNHEDMKKQLELFMFMDFPAEGEKVKQLLN